MMVYRLNPYYHFDTVRRQLNDVFDELLEGDRQPQQRYFPVEMEEVEDAFLLRAWLPGINRDDLDIEVSREEVAIAGEYRRHQPENNNYRFYSEFPQGKFRRVLSLPFPVENDKASADYNNGVLMLRIPKAPEAIHRVVKVSLPGDRATARLESGESNPS